MNDGRFFKPALERIIDMDRPLVTLAGPVDFAFLDQRFGADQAYFTMPQATARSKQHSAYEKSSRYKGQEIESFPCAARFLGSACLLWLEHSGARVSGHTL